MVNLAWFAVVPYVDEEIDRDWSRFVTPARVIVELRDGQILEDRVDYPLGSPKNMMSMAQLAAKTADCAANTAVPLAPGVGQRPRRQRPAGAGSRAQYSGCWYSVDSPKAPEHLPSAGPDPCGKT